jgi:hypothetical protein
MDYVIIGLKVAVLINFAVFLWAISLPEPKPVRVRR